VQLLLRNVQAPTNFDDHLAARDPYADHALVDFCRRLPLELREHGRLQCAYLRRFPSLAVLPNANDGVPPRLRGLPETLAARASLLRAHVRAAIAQPGGGPGEYARDLRSAGGAELLGILLERRTLERGQLREEPVRQLVAQTLSGRASHTRVLGMLLNLEFFQRRFLEDTSIGVDAPAVAVPG
jgi:hypothetical protein